MPLSAYQCVRIGADCYQGAGHWATEESAISNELVGLSAAPAN